jgi:hypothetical protein
LHDTVYVIDSESGPYNHPNWRDGVRIGPVEDDRVTGFIPPFERDDWMYQGTAGEGVAVRRGGGRHVRLTVLSPQLRASYGTAAS